MRKSLFSVILALWALLVLPAAAQDPVLFQGFYWDVPAGGTWWDTLAAKSPELGDAGVDMLWFPSPFKGFGGAYDMGYGIADHFDAGEFDQNGTVETRFGSRTELTAAIQATHSAGMEAVCDIVFNHVFGGNPEYNPFLEDYILTRSWWPVMPYDKYLYVYESAPAGRYYVQLSGNQYNHSQTGYDDREGYYSIRPWFTHSSGMNADGQAHWYEWDIGDGDSGPFDAFLIDLPGRVMEGQVNGVGDVDEFYIDHTGGWLEFKLNSTDGSGMRDFVVVQLWYDPDINQGGDDYEVSSQLKIYSYTNLPTASNRFPKDYRNYHPTDQAGHNDIAYEYHYPYFGNDLCYHYAPTLDSLKAWGEWLTGTLGFDGFRFDLAKGTDPAFLASWINEPGMTDRYYVGEHWSSAGEIKSWVDQVNANLSGSRPMTGFDFPLFYALKEMCDNSGYDIRGLHSAGLYPLYGNGVNLTTFVHNHDVFRPYTSAHNPIVNNLALAYAFILTHPGTATIFYPDYFGGTFYNADSSESFTMGGLKSEINTLLSIRENFVGGNFYALTALGNPDYKPGDDPYNGGTFSEYAPKLYVAQREGSGGLGGSIVVINTHPTDAVGAWVTVQGAGVGASFLRDQTGNRSGTTEVYGDNRVFVSAPPLGYAVWADADYNLSIPVARLKAFLRGPYNPISGAMSTYLGDNALIPLTQPFSGAPWSYGGSESVAAIPGGITDWILVELRSENTPGASPVARRAAFLRGDGMIVDLDGSRPLSFDVTAGKYYVVLRHRNHLSVMSKNQVTVDVAAGLYDFSSAQAQAFGIDPLVEVSGVFTIPSGDCNADDAVDVLDKNLVWRPQNGQVWGYGSYGDFNLDGGIDVLDLNLHWRPRNGSASQVP